MQPLNYFKAGREGYVRSIQMWLCVQVSKCFTGEPDRLQAFQICVS